MSKVEELVEMVRALQPAELEEFLSQVAGGLVDPPISQDWLDVAVARSQALASGESKGIPWAEVRERMYRKVNGPGH